MFLSNSSCNNINNNNKHNQQSEFPPFDIDIVWLWNGKAFDMRYSLRSVCLFIKWYHKIYIILPRLSQIPPWINKTYIDNKQITFIPEKYFFNKFNLTNSLKYGTNNSEQIESMIHHIDGLSEYFIYFNDDMMIGRPIPWYFFYKFNEEHGKYLTNIHPKYVQMYSNILLIKNGAYNCPEKHENIMNLLKHDKLPKGRVNTYIEHHPRPFIKSELFLFESMYPEFLEIIRSHNGNRWNSCNDKKRYFAESIWFYILRYKIDDEFEQFHANILQKNDLPLNKIYHSWIRNQFGKLRLFYVFLKEVTDRRPYTLTIQDDFIPNAGDQIFGKYMLLNFYKQYFSKENNKCIDDNICHFENIELYDEMESKYKIALDDEALALFESILNAGFQSITYIRNNYKNIHLETPAEDYDIDKLKSRDFDLNVLKFRR